MSCKIHYNIISSGSKGNAVLINDCILIDCGVKSELLKPYWNDIKIVLLTHVHGDHFKKTTIKKLAKDRPTVRFGCCKWLVDELVKCGVSKNNIDVYDFEKKYNYGVFELISVSLVHNVPNCGYKLKFKDNSKMIYATDTNNLNGVIAQDYDLYMIESNYDDEEIQERIRVKEERGEYVYEHQVLKNHLSKTKCMNFIAKYMGDNGTFIAMHIHED